MEPHSHKPSTVVNDMDFFHLIIKHLGLNDDFEIDMIFGLSMQCIFGMILAFGFGLVYLITKIYEPFYLMTAILFTSSGLLIYSRKNGRFAPEIVCTGINIQCALVHLCITYYIGNCGTVFFLLSALLIPHLYPLLKPRSMFALGFMQLLVINLAFWISLDHTPIYADYVGNAFRFLLCNVGLIICMLELYLNLFSVKMLEAMKQRIVDNASKKACLDALTGLGNRHMLWRHKNNVETETEAPLCIAIIDIDFFKQINDSYGHAAGDKVLVLLAESMKKFFRKSDLVIRWGGEEFLIILRYTELINARMLMERFRVKVQESPVSVANDQMHVQITVGLAEHRFGTPLDDSIERADQLLYRGKAEGRNRVMSE